MVKTFEGVFELFDLEVRRLRNGNKLRFIFESQEDLEAEKKLIEFRGCHVESHIAKNDEAEDEAVANIDDSFEVFDIKCRRLRNGDKLRLILEQEYRKEKELTAVSLRYDNCKLFLKTEQQELDFEDEDDMEEEELFEEHLITDEEGE